MSDPSFWASKRVFLTGHSGFKGSWLSLLLKQLGAQVYGFSIDVPTEPSLYRLADVESQIDGCVWGDVGDLQAVTDAMASCQPEVVIHFAAQPLVRLSYKDPLKTFQTNVMGTANVLEAVRQIPSVKAANMITTDKCYHNNEWPWGYREIDPLGGKDPYSASKAGSELVTAAYRESFFPEKGTLVASSRAGNVIGGGDWAEDRIMTDIIRCLTSGDELTIRNPGAIRPWQHVLEPLWGYLRVCEELYNGNGAAACAWNFGPYPESMKTVGELVSYLALKLQETNGPELRVKDLGVDSQRGPHEATLLFLDASKANRGLDWTPLLDFRRTLDWCHDWMRVYFNKEPIREFTCQQIERYLNELERR